jgi:hypothetical protein
VALRLFVRPPIAAPSTGRLTAATAEADTGVAGPLEVDPPDVVSPVVTVPEDAPVVAVSVMGATPLLGTRHAPWTNPVQITLATNPGPRCKKIFQNKRNFRKVLKNTCIIAR